MKIEISYDFGDGDLLPKDKVKMKASVEATVDEAFLVPDIRYILAQGIEPIYRHLQLSEREIERQKEKIRYGHILFQAASGKSRYRYKASEHIIVDTLTNEEHSVSDYLEGKLPK